MNEAISHNLKVKNGLFNYREVAQLKSFQKEAFRCSFDITVKKTWIQLGLMGVGQRWKSPQSNDNPPT